MEENIRTMKPVKDLDFLDRYVFDNCIQNPEICKTVLELSLSQELLDITYASAEKTLETHVDSRSVRLDLLAFDSDNNVYDAEAQARNTYNIPKRSRYYQAHMDVSLLKPGTTDFNQLNTSYMIFIADFDLFGHNKYRYTFQARCKEVPDLTLEDGATRVFLNTKGTNDNEVPADLVEFLHYLDRSNQTKIVADPKVKKVADYIENLKESQEFGVNYMREWEDRAYIREEGRTEGAAEERLNNARNVLDLLSDEVIAERFHLPLETVQKLREENGHI